MSEETSAPLLRVYPGVATGASGLAALLLGLVLPATAAAANVTLDWSAPAIVWNDSDLQNTYALGGIDVRISVTNPGNGTFTGFGVTTPYEDGPPPASGAFFGCCLDLGVLFNPSSGFGATAVPIVLEFFASGTTTPVNVNNVKFEISDIDWSPSIGGGEQSRTDQVVVTSNSGSPTLTAKNATPSFSIVGNTATSNGVTQVANGSDNGTAIANFGTTALNKVTITYNEVSGNLNPGPRGIGLFFALTFTTEAPAIDIEKATNGFDADTAPGPSIAVGLPVAWTYVVTNTGDVSLTGVSVTDDQGVSVSCPLSTLAPAQMMTCTANGTAQLGPYANVGTAQGTSPLGATVQDADPSHYFGLGGAAIDIEKATNGNDADTPPGPSLVTGNAVTWTYVVTNTGAVTLSNVALNDDQLGAISCPKSTLAPGESMTCTANGTVQNGQYTNTGTATGISPGGTTVQDSDPSHYFGSAAGIDIEKATNGQDADAPAGPGIPVGDPVNWTYVVTNNGNSTLTNVTVTDDQGVAVTCPKTTLVSMESMTCTATGSAQTGQYHNTGTATGNNPTGGTVQDTDMSHYFGEAPAIHLEKLTAGHDADIPPGPSLRAGDPVTWTYVVTNSGNVTLSNVAVSDDQLGAVTCPKTSLIPGETMLCASTGTVQAGQYANTGTATGESPSMVPVQDDDPSHYFGEAPAIDIEKATNGQDADSPAGPSIPTGDPVAWTYVVTNSGNVTLTNVAITDDQGVTVSCPKTTLMPMESMTCTAAGTAQSGQYQNTGTATGDSPTGGKVSDSDLSHYLGTVTGGPAIDIEKSTNGQNADTPPGATVLAGNPVTWTYVVTNVGSETLAAVTVSDDQGVAVSCPKTTLLPMESMTCTASGTAQPGQYANIGTASGQGATGGLVQDSDPSHYFGSVASVDLVKRAGGAANGQVLVIPTLPATVTYSYDVTNTGDVHLSDLMIEDDRGTPDPGDNILLTATDCPGLAGPLAPGASLTCTADIVVNGDTTNIAVVSGNPTDASGNDIPGLAEAVDNDAAVVQAGTIPVVEIPTLGQWGLILLASLLALAGLAIHRRMRFAGR